MIENKDLFKTLQDNKIFIEECDWRTLTRKVANLSDEAIHEWFVFCRSCPEIFDAVEFHDALLEDCVVIIKEPEWTLALRPSIKELPQLCCRAWELDSLVLGGVVSIGCMAFARSKINAVVISEGCLHVEGEAFRGAHIHKLYLPKSLDSIDAVAFYNSPVESVFYPGSKEDFMSLCTAAQYNMGFRKQSKVTVNCNDGILELPRLS